MADVFTAAALAILAATAFGLFRVLRSRIAVERMMAVQLLGTGGVAALLLLGAASGVAATSDAALLLMLFAAFSCAAFTRGEEDTPDEDPQPTKEKT
ncbi:monovalent cation/H+ antiporter complex subunit F [Chelatococcus asaccharovorans]|uniref:Multisubunit sodium/proton antiporter MrpF subunit n=1 Tax=Chelatococcus asaccharovorans TaxID=28210 RepID=A0A2V3U182_9HYPH|nr:monovalent cation/H+ antiporter complex subunit F [Chelatococcus asaccharovorans]MBS7707609.1 multiple resistance and pH regulation protein F [Chelatococcus asaccharovorans]PXW55183.1 multisubunit sodium/proton antiporter MrpF subunit [Chelatococcus asaccharovorans]